MALFQEKPKQNEQAEMNTEGEKQIEEKNVVTETAEKTAKTEAEVKTENLSKEILNQKYLEEIKKSIENMAEDNTLEIVDKVGGVNEFIKKRENKKIIGSGSIGGGSDNFVENPNRTKIPMKDLQSENVDFYGKDGKEAIPEEQKCFMHADVLSCIQGLYVKIGQDKNGNFKKLECSSIDEIKKLLEQYDKGNPMIGNLDSFKKVGYPDGNINAMVDAMNKNLPALSKEYNELKKTNWGSQALGLVGGTRDFMKNHPVLSLGIGGAAALLGRNIFGGKSKKEKNEDDEENGEDGEKKEGKEKSEKKGKNKEGKKKKSGWSIFSRKTAAVGGLLIGGSYLLGGDTLKKGAQTATDAVKSTGIGDIAKSIKEMQASLGDLGELGNMFGGEDEEET